ncbi:MAG: hypothetical protein K5639_07965 [Eubacterium sp.]|nr:hypothetical protein [Eubacterium sp.]
MQDKDVIISEKILRYCKQISETHKEFNNDKNLFLDTESSLGTKLSGKNLIKWNV